MVHRQKGRAVLHVEIQRTHEMEMEQFGDGLRFLLKAFDLVCACQAGVQYHEGGPGMQTQMLAQKVLSKADFANQPQQAIGAWLLPNAISHASLLWRGTCLAFACVARFSRVFILGQPGGCVK
jgi:hypothetical protein